MIRALEYHHTLKHRWDKFISESKNGHFIFYRDYMEYHSDRFMDSSLLFFEEDKLIALMPANIADDTIVSHGGLTFGGIISDIRMTTPKMVEVFNVLKGYLSSKGLGKLKYKIIPHIYHIYPAEEDQYCLFLNNANLVARSVSSSICMDRFIRLSKGRKHSINKAKKLSIQVKQNTDFYTFMKIEENLLLDKYGVKPVHMAEEMILLAGRYPNNIKLFSSYKGSEMIAGIIIYESMNVAHTQYMATTEEGKCCGALDLIVEFLLNYYKDKIYFDFGISTELNGRLLNSNLIAQKEMFGARAIVYDTYELTI